MDVRLHLQPKQEPRPLWKGAAALLRCRSALRKGMIASKSFTRIHPYTCVYILINGILYSDLGFEQMKSTAKAPKLKSESRRSAVAKASTKGSSPQRERVLIEFSSRLLQQTDEAARSLNRNRSELIRFAVEDFLNGIEAKKFQERLAAAYTANSHLNRDVCQEFEAVDREGF